jgi:hypothetical protein
MKASPHFLKMAPSLLVLGALALGSTACRPAEGELPFQSIEQRETAPNDRNAAVHLPRLIVIAEPEDIAEAESLITPEARQELQEMDFQTEFAVLVNQGLRSAGGYTVNVQRVVRRDAEITILANFLEPEPGEAIDGVESIPYQLIRIPKTGEFGREFNFTLLASTIYHDRDFVP